MIVCITEKPSVAKDIAAILGARTRRDGYYEGGEYKVTWTYGHLCTLKEPADYTPLWKRWSLGQLPMIPDKFSIKIIHQASIQRQFKVIETLIKEASEIINCGDAGQEGELIQRWVMQKAGVKCPVRRLWISSLTDESIREGFNNLRPQTEFDKLYHAGLSRAIGDWVLGMNATRLYTLKYSTGDGTVLSVGRVQTPTLALIVDRQKEIDAFKSEDFWELHTTYRDTDFSARTGRYHSEAEVQIEIDRISSFPLTITNVEQKDGRESPPKLFDLTSLQVECNKKWGWSADETLGLIQTLYEKKTTTYPRVDTTYLSTDIHAKIPGILGRMTPYAALTAPILQSPITKSKRIFDNSKVTDHHAIIPTGESPTVLVGKEKQLYHLIALRFIAAFYPDCLFQSTTITALSADIEFRASGKVITSEGWRSILAPTREKEEEDNAVQSQGKEEAENGILPEFSIGENGPHAPFYRQKTTQAPKPYTEGTLLRAMESAGKTIDDEDLREAMKENGIGRPSTRSAIIETLFKRRYIERKRKSIIPTAAGIQLIDTINQELLKSAKLTGIWENRLRQIEKGNYTAAEFIDALKKMVSEIVIEVLADNESQRIVVDKAVKSKKKSTKSSTGTGSATAKKREGKIPKGTSKSIDSYDQIKCPECKNGHIIKGNSAFGCNRFREGCQFRVQFNELGGDMSPAALSKFIKAKMKKHE